ncbi:MAG: hypothetical protein JXX28_07410 [Deltaproteobacteria bacterium]|nr:hypothetical protein [Deltaproteobacteria bacterium]
MHHYRWDLDKTYLQTDIQSVRGLVKAALQGAADKRNIPGADHLLRALIAASPAARVSVVSGSPLQMRGVLEEKLRRDGIRCDRLILKDNLRNLRKGRWRALRGQLGYKLPALLSLRAEAAPGATETLFGDDAEIDAAIYAAYREVIAGRLSREALEALLQREQVYEDEAAAVWRHLARVRREEGVEDIFILVDSDLPLAPYHHLGGAVTPVFCWFQAGAVLWKRGRLGVKALPVLLDQCRAPDVGLYALGSLLQDLVRRGALSPDEVSAMLEEAPFEKGERALAAELVGRLPPVSAPTPTIPDIPAFLDAVLQWREPQGR